MVSTRARSASGVSGSAISDDEQGSQPEEVASRSRRRPASGASVSAGTKVDQEALLTIEEDAGRPGRSTRSRNAPDQQEAEQQVLPASRAGPSRPTRSRRTSVTAGLGAAAPAATPPRPTRSQAHQGAAAPASQADADRSHGSAPSGTEGCLDELRQASDGAMQQVASSNSEGTDRSGSRSDDVEQPQLKAVSDADDYQAAVLPGAHPTRSRRRAAPASGAGTGSAAAAVWQAGASLQQTPQPAARQAAPADVHADAADMIDSDLDSDAMLDALADGIRQALGGAPASNAAGASGLRQQDTAQHWQQQPGASEALRWQPETGLRPLVPGLVPAQPRGDAEGQPGRRQPAGSATRALTQVPSKEPGLAKQLVAPPRDPRQQAREARKNAPDTAGSQWFDLPATKITDEVKRDLRLLRLRGAYDPKRFYKSFDETKFPKHFQFGTVVDNPLDFYGGRLTKAERKSTLTEQLLADSELTRTRKRRYNKLQEKAQAHHKVKKRKTDLPRKKAPHHRPKH